MNMEIQSFLDALHALTLDEIRVLALDIDGLTATTAEEIEVTRAFLHIESTLRHQHRVREASIWGHRASDVVVDVARRAGVLLPDTGVTRVARWADTIARGIVADVDAVDDLEVLRHACEHVDSLATATLSLVEDRPDRITPRTQLSAVSH